MRTITRRLTQQYLPLFLGVIFAGAMLSAAEPGGALLPEFQLSDPAGVAHGCQALRERGAVVIVTIPNVKHGETQDCWQRAIKKGLPPNGPILVLIEDLSQSNVREKALASMKKKYKPGQSTLLLLDETGQTRRAFGVGPDETAVLVFDREGRLTYRAADVATPDEIIAAAKGVCRAAAAMTPPAAGSSPK